MTAESETKRTAGYAPPARLAPKKGLRGMIEFVDQLRMGALLSSKQQEFMAASPKAAATVYEIEGYNRRLPVASWTVTTLTPEDVETLGDLSDLLEWLYQQKDAERRRQERFGR